jgi:hypothetical protein
MNQIAVCGEGLSFLFDEDASAADVAALEATLEGLVETEMRENGFDPRDPRDIRDYWEILLQPQLPRRSDWEAAALLRRIPGAGPSSEAHSLRL